jgi:hypothetical protein
MQCHSRVSLALNPGYILDYQLDPAAVGTNFIATPFMQ